MARTVHRQEHDQRRELIVTAARKLVFSKGYERMTVEDLRRLAGLSNGAFFHYFKSKPALLEALVDQMRQEGDVPLVAALGDSTLSPVEKLQSFFVTLAHMRSAHRDVVVDLLRGWYADDNMRVRQKVSDAHREHRGPLLAQVIQDGVQADMFTTANPEQAADITLTLIERMGTVHAHLLLTGLATRDRRVVVEEVLAVRTAFLEAIERILGAPINTLPRGTPEAVEAWLDALTSAEP